MRVAFLRKRDCRRAPSARVVSPWLEGAVLPRRVRRRVRFADAARRRRACRRRAL